MVGGACVTKSLLGGEGRGEGGGGGKRSAKHTRALASLTPGHTHALAAPLPKECTHTHAHCCASLPTCPLQLSMNAALEKAMEEGGLVGALPLLLLALLLLPLLLLLLAPLLPLSLPLLPVLRAW